MHFDCVYVLFLHCFWLSTCRLAGRLHHWLMMVWCCWDGSLPLRLSPPSSSIHSPHTYTCLQHTRGNGTTYSPYHLILIFYLLCRCFNWREVNLVLPLFRPKCPIVVFRKSPFSLDISKSTNLTTVKFNRTSVYH